MDSLRLLFAVVFASVAAFARTNSWPLVGAVTEPRVVSVDVHPFLYRQVTASGADALERELRIRDGQGGSVAYMIRPKVVRISRVEKEWHRLFLRNVTETNGQLIIEAEFPSGVEAPERFMALKVATPLHDFEERVTVSADGVTLAEGAFCDYRKFADLRKVEMSLDMACRRTFSVAFSKPVSPAEAEIFERSVTENVKDGDIARTVRRSVVDRPFRIDGLFVAVPKDVFLFEPAPAYEVGFSVNRCGRKEDVKAKKTVFEICSSFMPITGIRLNVEDENFSRCVRVMRRVRSGWVAVAEGKVNAVHLPGTKRKSLVLPVRGGCREAHLRIEVDNKDNPPISYGEMPVTALVEPCELVFVASPGETYSVVMEKEAEVPRYDLSILENAVRMENPMRWHIALPPMGKDGEFDGEGEPTSMWMTSLPDPIAAVSVVVFVVLGIVCIRLFRGSR